MGWYDAYKGNTARVNVNLNKRGDLVNAFGSAFSDFGKAITEDERYQDSKKQTALSNKLTNLQIDNAQTKATNLATTTAQAKVDDDYLTGAYSRPNQQSFDANRDKTLKPSATAKKQANTYFTGKDKELQEADKWVQKEVNDDLTKAFRVGDYKNFKELKKANPELVDYADGNTVASIQKSFVDTSREIEKLDIAKEKLSNQSKLLKKDAKIATLSGKKETTYTRALDSDIRSIADKAIGQMNDSGQVSIDKGDLPAYNEMVFGISKIAKEKGVLPNEAYALYLQEKAQALKLLEQEEKAQALKLQEEEKQAQAIKNKQQKNSENATLRRGAITTNIVEISEEEQLAQALKLQAEQATQALKLLEEQKQAQAIKDKQQQNSEKITSRRPQRKRGAVTTKTPKEENHDEEVRKGLNIRGL